MHLHTGQPGPLATATLVFVVLLTLAASIMLGAVVFAVLALSAVAKGVVSRLFPQSAGTGRTTRSGGTVIEGQYEVTDERRRPGPDDPGA